MYNKIFEQMQEIVNNKYKHGTIILIDNETDRGIGKTRSMELIAEIYGLTLLKKFMYPESGIKIKVEDEEVKPMLQHKTPYILDEGFTLEEINLIKSHYNIIFALVDTNYLGQKFIKIDKE